MKATIQRIECFQYVLMDEIETAENFGEFYLEEYGIEVSPKLLERYTQCTHEMAEIQKELRKLYLGKD